MRVTRETNNMFSREKIVTARGTVKETFQDTIASSTQTL